MPRHAAGGKKRSISVSRRFFFQAQPCFSPEPERNGCRLFVRLFLTIMCPRTDFNLSGERFIEKKSVLIISSRKTLPKMSILYVGKSWIVSFYGAL